MKVLELFGGIGACTEALKRLGIDFEVVDYVDNDKYAVKSYNAINGTNYEPQDICEWNKNIQVDLIMHGSPCQDFSLAGQQAGGDEGSGTRSSLMYETIRIVKKLLPKYVIWENVKNILSKKHRHNFENYLKELRNLGYVNYYQVLNAKDYGIPQNRERIFTVSIRRDVITENYQLKDYKFPEKQELKLRLKDLLEDEVDEKYYLSDKMKNVLLADRPDMNEYICNESPYNFNSLKIKNNTKQGYLEAEEGDGINTSSRMQWQRGNVQKQMSQTIDTSGNDRGVIVKGSSYIRNWSNKGTIQGDVSNTLQACMGTGGGNVPLVLGEIGEKDSNNGTQWKQQNRIYDNNVSISVTTCYNPNYIDNNLRIRKLTPKECWRLMGFSDEAFDKASKVNSNTQLYKQAGNSIVVNVLVEIFRNLL